MLHTILPKRRSIKLRVITSERTSRWMWPAALLFLCFGSLLILSPAMSDASASLSRGAVVQQPQTSVARAMTISGAKANGKIVFTSDRKGPGLKIWTMNPDGSNPRQLTDESARGPDLPPYMPVYDSDGKWSPDGTKIAFHSNRNYGAGSADDSHAVYVMNADGSDVRRIVIDLSGIGEPPEIGSFEWSPDGTKFLFDAGSHAGIPEAKLTTNLFTANIDGSNLLRLTNNREVLNGSAKWSPDGKQIAFTSWDQAGHNAIELMNLDGSNRHVLAGAGSYPSWAPDGSKILFVGPGGNAGGCENYVCDQLHVVRPDGSNLTQLTHYAASYVNPKWSPDGTKIVFERNLLTYIVVNDPLFGGRGLTDNGHAIFVMNADGSNQINISNRPPSSSAYDVQPEWQPLFAPANLPPPSILGFSARLYLATYPDPGRIEINVTRTGNLNQAVSCDYQTGDGVIGGLPRGSLSFAPGETSKTILFPSYYDSAYKVSLFNNGGNATFIGGITETTVVFAGRISNPDDNAAFFVRQQYSDFLNREPDQAGFDYWVNQLTRGLCDQACVRQRRIAVSDAFFFEPEFQKTGAFVYRVYKAAFGTNPTFAQFASDRARVVGGSDLDQSKSAFALNFVGRDAFLQKYPRAQTADQFVNALLANVRDNSGVGLTPQCGALTAIYDGTDNGRAAIVRRIADTSAFIDAEYNRAFVLTEYFGYLRRDPDQAGYDFWLSQVNRFLIRDIGIQHAMVCSFITSAEYQNRFSSIITRTNAECPQ